MNITRFKWVALMAASHFASKWPLWKVYQRMLVCVLCGKDGVFHWIWKQKEVIFWHINEARDTSRVLIETIVLKRDMFCIFSERSGHWMQKKMNKKVNGTNELEKVGCSKVILNEKKNPLTEIRVTNCNCW